MDYKSYISIFLSKTKIIATICLYLMICSCTPPKEPFKSTDVLKTYKIKNSRTPYYIFKYGDEIYNIFYNWRDTMYIDSIINEFGIEIDSSLSLDINNSRLLFDTLYYSNYCYEKIIFDIQSVCFTKDECFLHICSNVGHANICFSLTESEKYILSSLINVSGMDKVKKKKDSFVDDRYGINMRFRYVNNKKTYDLIVSDTSPEFAKYALLNSFILALSNKYSHKNTDLLEEYAPFLKPAYPLR